MSGGAQRNVELVPGFPMAGQRNSAEAITAGPTGVTGGYAVVDPALNAQPRPYEHGGGAEEGFRAVSPTRSRDPVFITFFNLIGGWSRPAKANHEGR